MNKLRIISLIFALAVPVATAAQGIITSELQSCSEQQLSCGNELDSKLPADSCMTTCGESAEVWRVHAFLNTTLLTVTATSATFDPRLDLIDANGTLIESNDSVGGTHAAQISRVVDSGSYLFRVVGQPAGAAGDYKISLHCLTSDRKNFCIPDNETLCLAGHFSFNVTAVNRRGGDAAEIVTAIPRPQNELYGFFSFPAITGNADNPEVFVKLIDGRSVNGHWWIFWGGLTDVDYAITVRDSFTKTEKRFQGQGQDTTSFGAP